MYSFLTIISVIMIFKGVVFLLGEAKYVQWSELPHNLYAFAGDHVSWIIVGLFLILIFYGHMEQRRANRRYQQIPTSDTYSSSNPHHPKSGGQSCRHCGSRSIRNWGRTSANDSERVFICNHCGKELYRNG